MTAQKAFAFDPRARRRLFIALAAIALVIAAAPAQADAPSTFAPTGAARELKGAPGIFEWRFDARVGASPFDRIALHRTAHGPTPPEHPSMVVLYLPGTNQNGEVATDDPHHALPIYLAGNGVDVWALDYRTHFVPADATEAQLGGLKSWTSGRFESDIDAAVQFVLASTHRDRLFLSGFSRGVEFAYLYAAMHPARVQGLVILDGYIPRHPSRAVPADRIADDLGGKHLTFDKRKRLVEMVIANPDQPAPIPKYKTARENLEHVVYDSAGFGGKGGLANPLGGFSDATVLARVMLVYDRWWPAVQDYENPFTPALLESLKQSKIPVIAFSSTNMAADWPKQVDESAHSTGSADVTVHTLKDWGHLDVMCGTKAEAEVYAPALGFIRAHSK